MNIYLFIRQVNWIVESCSYFITVAQGIDRQLKRTMEDEIRIKRQELEALKKITGLTDTMKEHLDELSIQVLTMHSNAGTVAQVLSNWDSILKSISQASLGLQKYTEGDYNTGVWDDNNSARENDKKEMPLPETLVRMRVDGEE